MNRLASAAPTPDPPTSRPAPHLPTDDQRLLLQAILGPADQTIARWRRWQARVDLNDLDHGSFRLIPMLSHVLAAHAVEDPDLPRYRGIARKSWYKNQITFATTETIIRELQAMGVPVLVLKGMALAHRYYPEPGLRPMADGDILVPFADAPRIIDWLCARGWIPTEGHSAHTLKTFAVRKQHGINLRLGPGRTLDLHWRVIGLVTPVGLQEQFWAVAEPLRLRQVEAKILSPTDQFFHVCAHGVAWSSVPPLRWVTDAMLVLRRDGARIDWERLIRLTREHHLALFVAEAIAYLREHFDAPVDAAVVDQLRAIPVAAWERREHALLTDPNPLALRDYWGRQRLERMRHTLPEWGAMNPLLARIRFLQLHWELDRTQAVFLRVASRLIGKAGRKIRAWVSRLRSA